MEVGSGHAVPGEAGRGTRFETWGVIYEVGDDHFQNFHGNSVGLLIHRTRPWSVGHGCTSGRGFCPAPNNGNDDSEPDSYDTSTTERGAATEAR